ncbi:hypothetical protein FRC08_001465 [Ceratobasidium sp. 394]|nr:hypothetical protein FRC08_001465 [Ceratobasidium sp. 394]
MATAGHNVQNGDSLMASPSLNPQDTSHIQPPLPLPVNPSTSANPVPPQPSQVPLPNSSGGKNTAFEEQVAQHASSHQPFHAPFAQPFAVPPVESVPPAPFVQWQPEPHTQPLHNQPGPPRQPAHLPRPVLIWGLGLKEWSFCSVTASTG